MPFLLTPWKWRIVWWKYDKLPERCASQSMVTSFFYKKWVPSNVVFSFSAVVGGVKLGLAVPFFSDDFWTLLLIVFLYNNVFRYLSWNISILVNHRHRITSISVNSWRLKASKICWMSQSPSVLGMFLADWLL